MMFYISCILPIGKICFIHLDQVYNLKDSYIVTPEYLQKGKSTFTRQLLLVGQRLAVIEINARRRYAG